MISSCLSFQFVSGVTGSSDLAVPAAFIKSWIFPGQSDQATIRHQRLDRVVASTRFLLRPVQPRFAAKVPRLVSESRNVGRDFSKKRL